VPRSNFVQSNLRLLEGWFLIGQYDAQAPIITPIWKDHCQANWPGVVYFLAKASSERVAGQP